MSVIHLLSPRWIALRRPGHDSGGRSPLALLFFATLGIGFWLAIYWGSGWLCQMFLKVPDIGDVLLRKLLSMVFLTFFSILIFSNLVTAFSTFFLADDLQLLNSSPVRPRRFFVARMFETSLHSSWMILVFGLPLLLAYGQTFQASPMYYVQLGVTLLPFVAIPSALALMVALVLATVFPARRMRDMVMLLFVLAFAGLYLYFRALQPERFLDPNKFSETIGMLGMLRDPTSAFLPSDWVVTCLFAYLSPDKLPPGGQGIYLQSLYLTAAAMLVLSFWLFEWLYLQAFSRAQEGKRSRYSGQKFLEFTISLLSWPFRRSTQTMLAKEFRTFLRNPGQWAQLLLLGALIVVYIFNFSSLRGMSSVKVYGVPAIITEWFLYTFNLGLLGFVISAVAVRFAFPAVSLEGRCFWIIRQSPVSMESFLQSKFWSVFLPLFFLAELMTVTTNIFLHSSLLSTWFAMFVVLLMTLGITGMGVGLGAVYPRFGVDNPAKIASGFGGVLFMICSMMWVVVLLALSILPLIQRIRYKFYGISLMSPRYIVLVVAVLLLSMLFSFLAYRIPMRMGVRSLEKTHS